MYHTGESPSLVTSQIAVLLVITITAHLYTFPVTIAHRNSHKCLNTQFNDII